MVTFFEARLGSSKQGTDDGIETWATVNVSSIFFTAVSH